MSNLVLFSLDTNVLRDIFCNWLGCLFERNRCIITNI